MIQHSSWAWWWDHPSLLDVQDSVQNCRTAALRTERTVLLVLPVFPPKCKLLMLFSVALGLHLFHYSAKAIRSNLSIPVKCFPSWIHVAFRDMQTFRISLFGNIRLASRFWLCTSAVQKWTPLKEIWNHTHYISKEVLAKFREFYEGKYESSCKDAVFPTKQTLVSDAGSILLICSINSH